MSVKCRVETAVFAPIESSVLHKMEMLNIYDVFKLQLAKFIFNCIHLNTSFIFLNWFKLNYRVDNYNTRSKIFDIDNA